MEAPYTITFDLFWKWINVHPNCILRAGTPDAAFYDDDDLHWHFASEEEDRLVQILRGKRLLGELLIRADLVTYVQGMIGESEGEHIFELVSESESERSVLCTFVLAHAYEEERDLSPARVH